MTEPVTIQLNQTTETQLTTLKTPFGMLLYMYARSGDSVSAKTTGQDYVAFRYDDDNLTFAVCDGVGQSFMGDLAARILGDGLNDWLWALDERPADEAAFGKQVTDALNGLVETSREQVATYELPSLPPIVKQALELQRDYGSESMFVAGRIALDDDDPWVALCWLGDSPVAAIDIDDKLVDLGPHGHTSERWNATTGVKGEIHTWVSRAERVARVAGYTDGLTTGDVPTDEDLANLMTGWVKDPPADDASLFDVRLAPSRETVGEPDPEIVEEIKELSFSVDDTRPIPVPDPTEPATRTIEKEAAERQPVKEVEQLESPAAQGPATGEWRPLTEQPQTPEKPDSVKQLQEMSENLPDAAALANTIAKLSTQEPSKMQQVQIWQQAALLGLTSAALAMLMVERLAEQENDNEE